MNQIRRIPITLSLAGLVLLLQAMSSWAHHFEFLWTPLDLGGLYRIATCHFLHWSWNHMAWDLAMFVVLGSLCERRVLSRFLVTLALSLIAIPLAVMLAHPELETYRGLSGIDSGLFALLAVDLLIDRIRRRDGKAALLFAVCLLSLGIKIIWETQHSGNIFVSDGSFVPVPLAHLVGGLIGCLIGISQRSCTELVPYLGVDVDHNPTRKRGNYQQ